MGQRREAQNGRDAIHRGDAAVAVAGEEGGSQERSTADRRYKSTISKIFRGF
jgi:hypothetical protein